MGRLAKTKYEVIADIINQLKTQYIIDNNDCWVWSGLYYGNGYGRLRRFRPIVEDVLHQRAHISSFIYHTGIKITKGQFICHTCDNKGCINPNHLWLGSNKENQLDASRKGVFNRYWTVERRKEKSKQMSGSKNPMYGIVGAAAPCFGRTGSKHPMFGKHHTEESKRKISAGVNLTNQRKHK